MIMMMILSYVITSFIDLKTTHQDKEKAKLIVYFVLMFITFAIGTASEYVENMPSPAEPIKNIVFTIMGK